MPLCSLHFAQQIVLLSSLRSFLFGVCVEPRVRSCLVIVFRRLLCDVYSVLWVRFEDTAKIMEEPTRRTGDRPFNAKLEHWPQKKKIRFGAGDEPCPALTIKSRVSTVLNLVLRFSEVWKW